MLRSHPPGRRVAAEGRQTAWGGRKNRREEGSRQRAKEVRRGPSHAHCIHTHAHMRTALPCLPVSALVLCLLCLFCRPAASVQGIDRGKGPREAARAREADIRGPGGAAGGGRERRHRATGGAKARGEAGSHFFREAAERALTYPRACTRAHTCMHARTHARTHAHTHVRTHARTTYPSMHTSAPTHARTHAHTHTRTHAHTHNPPTQP